MARRLSQKKIDWIYELKKEEHNYKQISRKVGVSHSTAIKYAGRDGENEISYRERLLIKNGESTLREHRDSLAKKKGFNSDKDYQKYLIEKKQSKVSYKKLSLIVSRKIERIQLYEKLSQSQIARNCDLTRQTLSAIKLGKFYPREEYLEKLCNGLGLKKSALEKILKTCFS